MEEVKDDLERIKEKLRKLMRKEESARELGNLAEAEAFATKIQQMLINYELEIAEIKDSSDREILSIDEELIDCSLLTNRHESSWVVFLYDAAAKGNFCKVIITGGGISKLQIILIGNPINKEFTHYMVHQMLSKLRNLSRLSFKEYKGADKRNTYIRSFLRGASTGLGYRLLEELKNQSRMHEKTNAMVINKGAQLQDYMNKTRPNLGSSKARKTTSGAGYSNGYTAGKNVSINKGVASKGKVKEQRLLN